MSSLLTILQNYYDQCISIIFNFNDWKVHVDASDIIPFIILIALSRLILDEKRDYYAHLCVKDYHFTNIYPICRISHFREFLFLPFDICYHWWKSNNLWEKCNFQIFKDITASFVIYCILSDKINKLKILKCEKVLLLIKLKSSFVTRYCMFFFFWPATSYILLLRTN